jgi:hypothetical protein
MSHSEFLRAGSMCGRRDSKRRCFENSSAGRGPGGPRCVLLSDLGGGSELPSSARNGNRQKTRDFTSGVCSIAPLPEKEPTTFPSRSGKNPCTGEGAR